jgi:hypothetical protein
MNAVATEASVVSSVRETGRRSFDVACTVTVSHRPEDLSAHVELDDDVVAEPGDRVVVHGDAPSPPFGEVWVERRVATVTRASLLQRIWVRLTGNLDCLSLLEVSFSERRTL